MSMCVHAYDHVYMYVYLRTCIHSCMRVCMRARTRMCICYNCRGHLCPTHFDQYDWSDKDCEDITGCGGKAVTDTSEVCSVRNTSFCADSAFCIYRSGQ
jgi:hypothetical protein